MHRPFATPLPEASGFCRRFPAVVVKLALCLAPQFVAGQEGFIYNGETRYTSTSEWNFDCEACSVFHPSLGVTVGKREGGGLLMLSVEVLSTHDFIKRPVYLYLADESLIKCADRGIRDYADKHSKAIFYFTDEEMGRLAQVDVSSIRFSVANEFGKPAEGLTAENEVPSSETLLRYRGVTHYDTAAAIAELLR